MTEPPDPPSLPAAIASRGAPQSSDQLADRIQVASKERGGAGNCGVGVLESLIALASALTGTTGREKSILFVGIDIAIASTVEDAGGYCAAFIYPARDKLTRALDAANVTFHVVDPRGHEPTDSTFRQQSLAVRPDYTGGRTAGRRLLAAHEPATAVHSS